MLPVPIHDGHAVLYIQTNYFTSFETSHNVWLWDTTSPNLIEFCNKIAIAIIHLGQSEALTDSKAKCCLQTATSVVRVQYSVDMGL